MSVVRAIPCGASAFVVSSWLSRTWQLRRWPLNLFSSPYFSSCRCICRSSRQSKTSDLSSAVHTFRWLSKMPTRIVLLYPTRDCSLSQYSIKDTKFLEENNTRRYLNNEIYQLLLFTHLSDGPNLWPNSEVCWRILWFPLPFFSHVVDHLFLKWTV